MGRLDGRVILISGGARGQGEAEARLFVEEGAKVVLGDVLDDAGEAVASELGDRKARYRHLDVTDESQWEAVVELAVSSFDHLDGLINNAGVLRFFPIKGCSVDAYMEVVRVNQLGVLLGMRAVIPPLEKAGGGTIVNISSVNGLVGLAGTVAYTASKFAVRGMTKVAAIELGPLGVRVNSIHPGGIDTPMVAPENLPGMAGVGDEAVRRVYGRLPLGRIGRTEEIARLAAFLSSDESSYCTGSEFVADGGMLAGPPA